MSILNRKTAADSPDVIRPPFIDPAAWWDMGPNRQAQVIDLLATAPDVPMDALAFLRGDYWSQTVNDRTGVSQLVMREGPPSPDHQMKEQPRTTADDARDSLTSEWLKNWRQNIDSYRRGQRGRAEARQRLICPVCNEDKDKEADLCESCERVRLMLLAQAEASQAMGNGKTRGDLIRDRLSE